MVIGNHFDFDLLMTLTNHFIKIYVYDLSPKWCISIDSKGLLFHNTDIYVGS